jgi:hypothetical protein
LAGTCPGGRSAGRTSGWRRAYRQFIELLTSAIAGGYAHVADAETDEEPEDSRVWGWRLKIIGAGEHERLGWQPQGSRHGWLSDDGTLLLEPGAAFASAQRMAREQGTNLPIGQRTLWKRMAEKGLLASRDTGRSRNTVRATIARKRKTVVHLIPGLLTPNVPNVPNGH